MAVQRTASLLQQQLTALLKPYSLSPTQYNVLRILRGAGADGLPCGEIGNRMITREPDMTRLLDRMETRRLVIRLRQQKDRRVVTVRIAADGLDLLAQLDRPVAELSIRQFAGLSKTELKALLALLDRIREPQ